MKDDNGGKVGKNCEVKVSLTRTNSTWNTKLNYAIRNGTEIYICTYSLPNVDYIEKMLDGRPANMKIVCNSKFEKEARAIRSKFPNIQIFVKNDMHAKIAAYLPETTILSSANFGKSNWIEHSAIIKNKDIAEYYTENIKAIIEESSEIL